MHGALKPLPTEWLDERSPHVRDRLLRLNPKGIEPGAMPRGWHPVETARRSAEWRGAVPYRAALKRFGSDLQSMPRECFIRHGKRRLLRREAALDYNYFRQENDPCVNMKDTAAPRPANC